MPDELMTLTMTREVFPHFKRILETSRLTDGDDEVEFTVTEGPPGVIDIKIARTVHLPERG